MNRNPFYSAILVAVVCSAPIPANAQPISLTDRMLALGKPKSDRVLRIKDNQVELGAAAIFAAGPDRFRLLTGTTKIKSRRIAWSWGSGALMLDTVRAKSPKRPDGLSSLNFNRFAVWNSGAGLMQDVDSANSVSIGFSYAQERRRPSFSVAAHNSYKTSTTAITLGWKHEESFALNASFFSTRPSSLRSTPERIVELAGGGPVAARGVAIIASFSPTHDPAALSFGIDVRRQRLGLDDARLIGIASGRNDTRIGLFLRHMF